MGRRNTRARTCKNFKRNADDDSMYEEKKAMLDLMLQDFDNHVKKYVESMECEMEVLKDLIRNLNRNYLRSKSAAEKNTLIKDVIYLNKYENLPRKRSIDVCLSAAENFLEEKTRKTRAKRVKINTDATAQNRVTRSTKKSKNIKEDMPPPTATSKRGRKPKNASAFVTPSSNMQSTVPLITPKFDPQTPVPPSSKRPPHLGEIAISLRGSPLDTSPVWTDRKLLTKFQEGMRITHKEELDPNTLKEINKFHEQIAKFLNK